MKTQIPVPFRMDSSMAAADAQDHGICASIPSFEPLDMTDCAGRDESPLFDPELDCLFHAADTTGLLREARRLVRRVHGLKGFRSGAEEAAGRDADVYDLLPTTARFLAEYHGRFVATLRTVTDSPLGLPVDEIFPEKLATLRQQGRVPCEVSSMVVDEEHGDVPRSILFGLFRLAYLRSTRIDGVTDMVASVMAHHRAFYRRTLRFDEVDRRSRISSHTGREVCFARLDLRTADRRYREYYGRRTGERNLHSFFCVAREPEIVDWLLARCGKDVGTGPARGRADADRALQGVVA